MGVDFGSGAGFGWGLMWLSWHPQAFVGKTDIFNYARKAIIAL
jgi:hypothetical protein